MIIEKKNIESRKVVITELYKTAFPDVATFVRKNGGSLSEAKDVFQDALLIYYEKRLEANFVPEYDHSHYLKGIARHLWYKKFRRETHIEPLSNEMDIMADPAEEKVSKILLHFLEQSGKRCLALLSAFYYEKINMKELAVRFGFSGERSATAQKYKCLEKVRNTIHKRALTKDDFYE